MPTPSGFCPRPTPQWNAIKKKVGVFEAYRLYHKWGYELPDLAFSNDKEVWDTVKSWPEIHVASTKDKPQRLYITYKDNDTYQTNREVVRQKIDHINKAYDKLLIVDSEQISQTEENVTGKYATGRKTAEFVDINSEALKEHYSIYEDRLQELKEGQNYDEPVYEQRITDDRISENRVDFESKKAVLLKLFPNVDNVVEDTSISQAGILGAGGKVIIVNPNLWYKDTLGHEFGHIMIDSLGYNSPLVQQGIKLLKDSKLEKRIRELYKDVYESNPEKYWKEVVTQAVGEEVSNIFDKEASQNALVRWLDRFYNKIKQLFGLEKDAIKIIAQKVTYEGVKDSVVTDFNEQRVKSNLVEEYQKQQEPERVTKLQQLYDQTKFILEKKIKIYKKRGKEQTIKNFEDTLEMIKKLDKDPVEALKLFRDFAVKQTNDVYARYLKSKVEQESSSNPAAFDIDTLRKWRNYVSAFNNLESMVEWAQDVEVEASNDPNIKKFRSIVNETKEVELEDGTKKQVNILDEVIKNKNIVIDAYRKEGSKLLAKRIGKFSTHVEAMWRDNLEREYNQLSKELKDKISKEDFIDQQIELISPDLQRDTIKKLEEEMQFGTKDINSVERWVDNLLDSPDVVVSTMLSAYVTTEYNLRQQKLAFKHELLTKLRSLEKHYSDLGIHDPTKLFDFMLEQGELGNYTGNLVSPDGINSGMWKTYNDLKDTLAKDEKMSEEDKDSARLGWLEDNAPLDKKGFWAAHETLIDSLLEEGTITKEEKSDYNNAVGLLKSRGVKFKLENIWKNNPNAVHLVGEWRKENTWAYRKPIAKWKNTKIDSINSLDSNDPRRVFYEFIIKNIEEQQKDIPYENRIYYRLPGIIKDTRERLVSKNSSIKDVLYHSITDNFKVLDDDTERHTVQLTDETGAPVYFIPIYYTNQVELKDQSFDIGGIYYKYFTNLMEYKAKQQILPEMELVNEILKERKVHLYDSKGNFLLDSQGIKQYKEGKSTQIAAQFDDWLKAMFYGLKDKDLGKILWGTVDVAKAARKLGRFTSLNMLGLNFVQGVANIATGETMQWLESIGGRYYNSKNYVKAKFHYYSHLPKALDDIGSREPSSLLGKFVDEFNFLNEYDDGQFRVNSKLRSLMHTSTMYFFSRAGEHFMQVSSSLAMLDHIEAKNSKGESLGTMLDCMKLNKQGDLVFEGKNGDKVANFNKEQRIAFEKRVRTKLSDMHGQYSDAGRVAAQNHAIMNLGLMFRKFIVTGIRRRYGKKRINNMLGGSAEGDYRVTFNFFRDLFKQQHIRHWGLITSDWANLTDREKASIRKTGAEMTIMLVTALLATAIINMKEEDDDDEWLTDFLAYQAVRYRAEMWFFANPLETMKILRSPAAAMSMTENMIKVFAQMMPPTFSGFDVYERGHRKGQLKIRKTMENLVPGYKQVYRVLYPEELINMFK